MELPVENKWHRTDDGKQIAGVCAGVAETYGVKADTVRWCYVLAPLVGAPMISCIYFSGWPTPNGRYLF
ncbi:PspC domain-containing protein [Corynebacterium sp. MSK297]|uniref:PspC domain-containing protein n=1 Tax=Corynebacterium sp. MSK297 TaxID=3050221 RepID=UPI00254EC615|nr:PspC domain-containing protein [Corynebacterium sp. MSK297]MDK8846363.1 PspC domain-containing protein [Corynebacterium sp. MSK297]